MNIQLKNFRRYENKAFSFEEGITRLSGESGIGKTTIFEAIEWCLYGKLRGVKTMKDGKKNNEKTVVSLSMNIPGLGEVQVDREGQNDVCLFIGDKGIEGVNAQSQIDKIFGTHDMFLLTSYLKAEQMHKMISASPAEKRELTSILFPEASKYILYKDKTTAYRRELEVKQMETKMLIQKLEGRIHGIQESNLDIEQNITGPESDLESLKKQLQDLSKKYDSYRSLHTKYLLLKDQLSSLPEIQDDIEWKSSLVDIRQKRIDIVVATSSREERIDSLRKKIDVLNENITQTLEEIDTQLVVVDSLLNIQIKDSSHLYQQLFDKQKLAEEYTESLECKRQNEKAKHILKCPECSVKLMHIENLLVTADQNIELKDVKHDITSKDLQTLLSSISKIENLIHIQEDAIDRRDKILKDNTQFEGKSSDELSNIRQNLLSMKDSIRERYKLIMELDTLEQDTRVYLSPEENNRLSSEEKRLSKLISDNDAIRAQRKSIVDQIRKLEKNEKWLSDESLLPSLSDQIQILQRQLDDTSLLDKKRKIRQQYIDLQKKLEENSISIVEIEKSLSYCAKLVGYLDETYNEYVTKKLMEIAKEVSDLGKIFFDDTMNITLLPGRESSNGVLKPSFDITVEYNGKIFEDIKCMSTGEKKRVSLILMMVLSKYTNGRFLLLDEALSSISMDKRAIIMNEIESRGLFTIITSHDEICGCTHEMFLTKQMIE